MPRVGQDGLPSNNVGGKYISQIMLKEDKEKSIFRFLTEFEDFFYERYHRNIVGGAFKGYKVCLRTSLGQSCDLCSRDEPTSTRFSGWVFEKTHDYRTNVIFKDKDIVLQKVGNIWRREVNAPMLLQASIMHFNPIEFRQDMYGTLLNRDYSWIRVGEAGSRRPSYMLEPETESEFPKELVDVREALPDLEDIALGKITSLDGEREEVKEYETREIEGFEAPSEPAF